MGVKNNRSEISALLKEKDATVRGILQNYLFLTFDPQIAYLECQVQAYISRTSHIHARLLSTLDTLDSLQASHNLELVSEANAKERLSGKLHRYIDFVREAEVEKDDLRDAVIQLVEKGGFRSVC
jgi:hypothetical protein